VRKNLSEEMTINTEEINQKWNVQISTACQCYETNNLSLFVEMELFVFHLICYSSKNWFSFFLRIEYRDCISVREVNINTSFCFENRMLWNRFSLEEMIEWWVLFSTVIVVSACRERHWINSRRQFFLIYIWRTLKSFNEKDLRNKFWRRATADLKGNLWEEEKILFSQFPLFII
jgi:hypothetical protein